jgi:hypothetical protein
MAAWFTFLFMLWIEINIIIFDHSSFVTIICHHKAARIILFHILWLLRDVHRAIVAAATISRVLYFCKFCILACYIGPQLSSLLLIVLLVTHFKLYSFLFFRLCIILLPFFCVFNWWLSVSHFWWIINLFLFLSRNGKIIIFLLVNWVAPSPRYQDLVLLLLHISFICNSY